MRLELGLVEEEGLVGVSIQADDPILGLLLDVSPLVPREQLLHGKSHTAHMLNPAHNLELLRDHLILQVRKPVPPTLAPLLLGA